MKTLIARLAPTLDLGDDSIDNGRLLAAISIVESNGGRNRQPNFEPAFYVGGRYWNAHLAELVNQWEQASDVKMRPWCGRAVACSWSPWQILYITAEELGFNGAPWELSHPATGLHYAIRLINKRIVPRLVHGDTMDTLAQIAGRYNAGSNWRMAKRYVAKVTAHYTSDDSPLNRLIELGDI